MAIRRTETGFEGAGGVSLHRRAWTPEAPERVVVLVHGFAEHSGRYEPLGAWLAERASAVHAFDLRGHGRSEGPRNHVDRFDDFLDDVEGFIALVRDETRTAHGELPLVVVGHSMGGLITCALARERRPDVLGFATSGPALSPGASPSRVKARLARVLARLAPRLSLDAGLPLEGLSRDPEVLRRYSEDPLIDTRMTVSLGAEMLAAVERTAGGGGAVERPMLMLHGADDPLCAASGSQAFFASLPDAIRERSALRIYPGLLHEIFNEPERLEVFDDLLSWIRVRERDGSAPAVAATGGIAS